MNNEVTKNEIPEHEKARDLLSLVGAENARDKEILKTLRQPESKRVTVIELYEKLGQI